MMLSSAPLSSQPFSSVIDDYAVASPFSALLMNQDSDRAYLLDCQPYDPVGAVLKDVGFSVGLRAPILNGRAWPARLGTVVNSEVNLFTDGLGSGGSSSFGVIKVLIGDEDHDAILGYAWDGRAVRVLMGAEGFDWLEFEQVFVGTAQDIEFDTRYLSIILRDKSELLRTDIQDTFYAGTGALEGGADLKNQPKPLAYGQVRNVSPVLVDRANLVYQWNDGAVQAVNGAYDGALALTSGGNVADITLATVTAGQYKTQNTGGYIKLGAEPAKAFTIDGQGSNAGGYVSSASDIVKRIVTNHSTLTTADMNLQTFADVNAANSAVVGWYGASGHIADVVSEVIESIGGGWTFDRTGLMVLGIFAFGASAGTVDAVDIKSIQRVRTPLPSWRRQLGYSKSWTVQGQADIVAAATTARKDFVAQEYRLAVNESAAIKTRRKLAGIAEVTTLLDDATAAATETSRQQGLFGADRSIYRIVAKRQQFKYYAGQTLTINYQRFGFPRDAIILGIVENTDQRYTEFRVFA